MPSIECLLETFPTELVYRWVWMTFPDSKDIINSGIKKEPNEKSEEPHGIGKKYAEKFGTFSGNFC